ncbi:diuretic hormone 31 isoform X3 [Bombyx mori]|uniref:diuretic hormone 31 isoform X3 n=1 Tax=Bombyx mori TaxID=7091 RepID=UPI00024B7B4B
MVKFTCVLASCVLLAFLLVVPSFGYPSINDYYRDDGQYDPDEIIDMLGRLGNLIQMERKMQNEKRAFDLGLGRGYSGALQAKHLMGLAAANFAGGPGRRRRNAQ